MKLLVSGAELTTFNRELSENSRKPRKSGESLRTELKREALFDAHHEMKVLIHFQIHVAGGLD
jgi:hypothetical protein